MKPSLAGVRAKLGRADEHLEALHAELIAFEKREPYAVTREPEPKEGWHAVYFHERERPPLRIGLILGDFFYNLRSALDHLAWQLCVLDGGSPGNHTGFPVITNPKKWPSAGGGALKGLATEHRKAIERLQPYPGRNDPTVRAIEAVNRHCNRDKHGTLHPVFAVASRKREDLIIRREPLLPLHVDVAYPFGWQPLEDGAKFAEVRFIVPIPEPKMKVEVEFPIGVAFGERGLVPKALPSIRVYIGRVVDQFAPDFGENAGDSVRRDH